jgi:hypothetical protein
MTVSSLISISDSFSIAVFQRVQVRRNIAAIVIGHAHFRHSCMSFDRVWMLNPPHQVRSVIGQFARNVLPRANPAQGRSDQPTRPVNAWNVVACVASVAADGCATGTGVATTSGHIGSSKILVTYSRAAAQTKGEGDRYQT